MIELRGASRAYRTPQGELLALAELDLRIAAGELIAVVGSSGSGKSTLINLVAGIDRPTAGSVRVAGADVAALSESALAAWRGTTVGVVFQFFQLLPTLTVLENVMLPIDFCGTFPADRARSRALDLLDRVGIADQAHKLPSALSGGQQQRAAIARALAGDPKFLLADEPTGNLDSLMARQVLDLLEQINEMGTTIIMVTHDIELARRAQRNVHVVDGQISDFKSYESRATESFATVGAR